MMRIAHVKLRSIFQAFNKTSSPDSGSKPVIQLFWCTVPQRKTYPVFPAKFSRRSLAREAMFAFEFSISYSHRHCVLVYNCFLLFFCSSNSKSSVPSSFTFHHSPSVVVISPASSFSQSNSPIKECL